MSHIITTWGGYTQSSHIKGDSLEHLVENVPTRITRPYESSTLILSDGWQTSLDRSLAYFNLLVLLPSCTQFPLVPCPPFPHSLSHHSSFCQTPIPGKIWELTLLSRCNKNKNNKNPHSNSPRRGCPRVLKF